MGLHLLHFSFFPSFFAHLDLSVVTGDNAGI